MPVEAIEQVCEVCGKPATNMSQDIFERFDFRTSVMHFSPSGIIHFGCTEHPARSTYLDVSTPLADAMANAIAR